MRALTPLLAVVLFLAFGWNRAAAASSRHRNFDVDTRGLYDAARDSLEYLHFHITSGSRSEGVIEAYRVRSGPGGPHRLSLTVRIRDGFGGGSDLYVELAEVAADESGQSLPGAKPGSPADRSLADTLFDRVEYQIETLRRFPSGGRTSDRRRGGGCRRT